MGEIIVGPLAQDVEGQNRTLGGVGPVIQHSPEHPASDIGRCHRAGESLRLLHRFM